jgi:hypothetical protein
MGGLRAYGGRLGKDRRLDRKPAFQWSEIGVYCPERDFGTGVPNPRHPSTGWTIKIDHEIRPRAALIEAYWRDGFSLVRTSHRFGAS